MHNIEMSSVPRGPQIDRRTFLRWTAAAGAVVALAPVLEACSPNSAPASPGGSAGGGIVTFGGDSNDQSYQAAAGTVFSAFTAQTGIAVKPTYTDNQTWQTNMDRYLQGNPDDVMNWACGYRMRYYAGKGLLTPLDEVWATIGTNYNAGFTELAKADDGHPYIVPVNTQPWGVFYRKSLWAQHGYQEPTTGDEMRALCQQMQKDGITPIGFANKDGWEAFGFFDYANFRTNGYDFHIKLLNNEAAWDSPEMRATYDTINSFREYWQPNFAGRTGDEACADLANKKVGMFLYGSYVGQAMTPDVQADLDFFTFPEINPAYDRDTIDAPGNGIMLTKSPKNIDGARQLAAFWGTPAAQAIYVKSDPTSIADVANADTSAYTDLQKKMVQVVADAKHVAQFTDRDTRPDFVSTILVPAYQQWLANPSQVDSILKSIDSQRAALFATEG